MVATSAGGAPTSRFKLEVQFPNGGTEMHLLDIGHPSTSDRPELRTGAGPRGPWSEEHYVVTEFEALSIGHHNSDQAMPTLEADKVPWHTINYVPGKRVRIPVENGQPMLLNGSIVDR